MRLILTFFSLVLILSCHEERSEHFFEDEETQLQTIEYNSTDFNFVKDSLKYQQSLYTGILISYFPNTQDTAQFIHFKKGVKHGLYKLWYPNGQLKEIRYFHSGKKEGLQLSFWENGNKRFEFTASKDRYEGELKEWDKEGRLSHLGNFKNGQEEGVQKMWSIDGTIRSNYIIKNGRRFGLLGTKNCVNVSDSIPVS